ncbi:periplasmic binding protein [Methanocorpusculum labreanum Z]|uniref:Periplasmic binding protein n=1 Tax=Methanocorpusculum labreanum (strain ATCC 43576 / DSM 4855 / Z) TaxID=410358 RepID=A2SSF5_METLZ|nr:ABC transporter substrate-binding protein [Methanocorpusculum labreanum]ABN07261.1 periplasmic binding protein [Methanocorpusculum labreanum Z]
MNKKIISLFFAGLCVLALCMCAGCVGGTPDAGDGTINITDSFGRVVTIPDNPDKIAVSGSGSMRYFVYLDVDLDRVVAVDYSDSALNIYPEDPRPYMLANPEILNISAVGASRGVVDGEKLLTSGAEILFIAASSEASIESANEIQDKTGIPVVLFYTGDYVTQKEKVCDSLEMLAEIMHKETRYQDLLTYFTSVENDLTSRVANVPTSDERAYVGGISYRGEHGLDGTNPTYYPFTVLHANNVASNLSNVGQTEYAQVSKEQILAWDPEIIFVGLGTLNAAGGGAIYELKNDVSYKTLTAVKTGEVYTVNPDISAGANYETQLVNAYYIGTVLYPKQFADVDLAKKADEIYNKVVGGDVYEELKEHMNGLSYQKIGL